MTALTANVTKSYVTAAQVLADLSRRDRAASTVQRMRVAANGGLEVHDVPTCDWCREAAWVRLTLAATPVHPDLACCFHLGYWFAQDLADGAVLTAEVIRG